MSAGIKIFNSAQILFDAGRNFKNLAQIQFSPVGKKKKKKKKKKIIKIRVELIL